MEKDVSRKDGKVDMCQALKELIEDGRMEGREEGRKRIVIKMVQKGKSDEEIMELTECSAQMLWEVKEGLKK